MMSRGVAPSAFSARTTSSSVVPGAEVHELRVAFGHIHVLLGNDDRLTRSRERRRLRGGIARRDANREVAVGDGRRAQAHAAADHDGAGALVDDDARRLIDAKRQHFDPCHQIGHRLLVHRGHVHTDRGRIDRLRRGAAELFADGDGEAMRVAEVGVAQRER